METDRRTETDTERERGRASVQGKLSKGYYGPQYTEEGVHQDRLRVIVHFSLLTYP